MKPVITDWDAADYLATREDQALYLDACIAEADGDAALIAKALGDIARARGMAQVAAASGLSRESLYKGLSIDGNPSFSTVLRVMKTLGLELHASAKKEATSA
ncbi:putative addiction module antidote protein [Chitinimonas arctica]|uniref:Putative addiction module antidote protein n=1 Tax=Chitinimonas arctica TaxID=2594795 RepID=A0A516SC32_9NEIS|nr:addiction module antidote protein [Chitinimonas arctica]QDQ25710.1 putative addiction module antidote protein [Chitinimonas arctica]